MLCDDSLLEVWLVTEVFLLLSDGHISIQTLFVNPLITQVVYFMIQSSCLEESLVFGWVSQM